MFKSAAVALAALVNSSARLIDWSPFVIMGSTMPPRDPDEDEEDEEEEQEDADEPPVVREPDED